MTRLFDIILSLLGLFILFPIMFIVFLLGFIDSPKPIFVQERVGMNRSKFKLLKFRTMVINTASVGTHEVDPISITKLGSFLRKYKIDELPQLINVLKGEMSMVGPRPCLPNQINVINERVLKNVFDVRPGITGLSQINEIDMSNPVLLAETDKQMIDNLRIKNYFQYIFSTALGKGFGDRVK